MSRGALRFGSNRTAGTTPARVESVEPPPVDVAHTTAPTTRALVHVRSCPTRAEAEAFAAALHLEAGRAVYLQDAVKDGSSWVRVLVGDFATVADAADFARRATAAGTVSYAKAVSMDAEGLRAYSPVTPEGAPDAAPATTSGGARSD
jgi:hypothetical protein